MKIPAERYGPIASTCSAEESLMRTTWITEPKIQPSRNPIIASLNPDKMEALKDQIRDALRDNKIRTKRVIFTVFSTKIISREIMISAVKEHQIGAFIESNLSEYFPIVTHNSQSNG